MVEMKVAMKAVMLGWKKVDLMVDLMAVMMVV